MSIFRKLFGASGPPEKRTEEREPEHAVIVHFSYGTTDLGPLFELEREIEEAIEKAEVGEFDGNEVAADGSDGYLYMYGQHADKLFEAIEPVLKTSEFMKGAKVRLRYGPPEDGVPEITKIIES
ncbi:MAG: hypothetical protein AAGH40_02925 [Verrucomicrobiota bacterium]